MVTCEQCCDDQEGADDSLTNAFHTLWIRTLERDWRGIAVLYGSSIFNFLGILHTVFYTGYVKRHFAQSVQKGFPFITSLPTLVTFCLLAIASFAGVK